MKSVGIITHYDVHNHGALLQLTALIRVLKTLGYEAKALQFDKNYDFLGYKLKAKYNVSIRSIGVYIKYLTEKGLGCTYYNFKKHRTLNKYKASQCIIGSYYTESKPLNAVIIGSDEVFALHTGPTPVFFGYCLPTENIISYAGSFGPTTLDDIRNLHSVDFVSAGLKNMKAITVRDANSADIVDELTGHRPEIVVDPVLLYGYGEELKNIPVAKKQKYLLVYSYDDRMNSVEEYTAIKSFAKSKGLKTLSPGFYHSWCDINVDVDPITLLTYFRDSVCVVTDTFHGAVMSLISGAKLVVKTRESNHFKLSNLLAEYNLNNRILTNWEDLPSVMDQDIDYSAVEKEIIERRTNSMNHLKEMLDKCK